MFHERAVIRFAPVSTNTFSDACNTIPRCHQPNSDVLQMASVEGRVQVVYPSVQPSLQQVVGSSGSPLKAALTLQTVPMLTKLDRKLISWESDAYHDPSIPYIWGIRSGNHENDFWSLIHEGLDRIVITFLAKTDLAKIAQDWDTKKLSIVWNDLTNSAIDDSTTVNFAWGRAYTLGCLEISKSK